MVGEVGFAVVALTRLGLGVQVQVVVGVLGIGDVF